MRRIKKLSKGKIGAQTTSRSPIYKEFGINILRDMIGQMLRK
jgi:hypothetical protein